MEASVVAAGAAASIPLTLHITPAEQQILDELAARRGVTATQILHEAIAEIKFFADHRQNGNQIIVKYPNGQQSNVSWPNG